MRDVAAFLETETGSRVFGAEAKVMKLCKGSVLWIPYGFVAIPVAVLEERDEEKKGASTKASLATFWVWCPLISELAVKVEEQIWTSIASWNTEHFARNIQVQLWIDRERVFTNFLNSLRRG